MAIFSFGKKDDASNRRGANSSSRRGSNRSSSAADRSERVERRTRRAERAGDADAMLLDPTLPEKQRARRRLVGAIALVVAAVVILPMVLDSHPKPVTDDISIDIPSRPVSRARVQDPQDTQAGVAPDNPVAPEGAQGAAAGVQSAPAPSSESPSATAANGASSRGGATQTHMQTQGEEAGKQAQQQTQSAGKVQQAPVTATNNAATNNAATNNAAAAAKPAARSTQSATQTGTRPESTAQSATAALAESGTPASPPGNRFAVQLGSFSDDASARSWASKLKAAGVPAYLEKRKQADGSTRTLLRAGPFADRAAASAAIAKVREAGLTSGPNNGSAQ
ncbi:SPOR domain-containing protein [Paraburkholderia sp. SARCC-3016]|uniref:SPOR domain-containing protein n=1 Tax=Paraburkholderia sp. SARCC-3016 TaxID=3058611 RepID=UPI0028069302|nr:SPOR domain-containing protein [Paraburkholderia sp. SARCC-3016]MDQ7980722.1 SPOR domain-containing protein [Paraburkholderia sp. SARCC-3016]